MKSVFQPAISVAAAIGLLLVATPSFADELEQAQIKALQSQVATMQAQLNALTAALGQTARAAPASPGTTIQTLSAAANGQGSIPAAALPPSAATLGTTALASTANAGPPTYGADGRYIERKPGPGLTLVTKGGELTAYGNFDVSVDAATKGVAQLRAPDGSRPVGVMGWQPDISTNLSFIGVRGFQRLPGHDLSLIYQLETQIDISSSSGTAETNSNQSNVVKGGLTSRNSYIGLASPSWGAVMIGKTDAPYKQSTARMNPFIGMVGDYGAIMGNTGGDNRVEFGTRLDHSLWYESPEIHGLKLTALYSPGQNRSSDSDNIAAGESDCTGGNVPGSGGSLPIACNDGAFSDAVSASLTYTHGPLYLVAAYERHSKVNRSSDLTGEYANPPAGYMDADTADEDAAKIGVQYALPTRTTISVIFEDMHRYVPGYLQFQNERQRTGYWFSATQGLTKSDSVSVGWAHANRTPGDPGQHNTSVLLPPLGSPGDGVGGAGADNSADMLTAAYKRALGGGLSIYFDVAAIRNGGYGHYALGAGGRAVTIDCHDASDASGGLASNPHCWAGGHPVAASTGLKFQF